MNIKITLEIYIQNYSLRGFGIIFGKLVGIQKISGTIWGMNTILNVYIIQVKIIVCLNCVAINYIMKSNHTKYLNAIKSAFWLPTLPGRMMDISAESCNL